MKRLPVILVLCALSFSATSQNLWESLVVWLKSRSVVDSSYIYQRPACFSVDGNFNRQSYSTTMSMNYDINTKSLDYPDSVWVRGKSVMEFDGKARNGIGFGIGYGNLGLGYGINLGADDKASRTFNFAIRAHKWGIGISYYGLNSYAYNEVTIADDTSRYYGNYLRLSNSPCNIYRVGLDAYWSLNRRKFAYTAAYKCSMLQRRSAGSMLISGNVHLNGMTCAEDDEIFNNSGIRSYMFLQASAGVGYSHNFVFFHRDPTGPKGKGLRNLTLNATIFALLSVNNTFIATPVQAGSDNIVLNCPISPNANGSLALAYSLSRWYFSLQYSHNLYYFRSESGLTAADLKQGDNLRNLDFSTIMMNWKLMAMAVFNF